MVKKNYVNVQFFSAFL